MLNMELKMMRLWTFHALDILELYNRLNEYLAIKADDEFYSMLVYNVIRFFYLIMGGAKFLQTLMAPEYLKAME